MGRGIFIAVTLYYSMRRTKKEASVPDLQKIALLVSKEVHRKEEALQLDAVFVKRGKVIKKCADGTIEVLKSLPTHKRVAPAVIKL
jgi:hypothetical protein